MKPHITEGVVRALTIVGGLTSAGAAYTAAGLPVPVTRQYVDGQVAAIQAGIKSLTVAVIEQQRESLSFRRIFLSNDRDMLHKVAVPPGDNVAENARRRHEEELAKQLEAVESRDRYLQDRLRELK